LQLTPPKGDESRLRLQRSPRSPHRLPLIS
jgi:hypothetical protein